MSEELLLHPKTKQQIVSVTATPPHALLIYGPEGSGKHAVAKHLIRQLLHIDAPEKHPYFLEINPEKTVGIDAIHAIGSFLSKKTTGTADIRRVVLIVDAHTMTPEAQNALLKTLEEPPADTMVIMTSDSLQGIKATIRSRTQILEVLPVSQAAASEYFNSTSLQQAYLISDGRVGLLSALLADQEHPLMSSITEAKKLLVMTTYERLVLVDKLAKDREEVGHLLEGLERVALSGMRHAATKAEKAKAEKFHRLNTAIAEAKTQLEASVGAKLVLTDLFLHM